MKQDLILKTIPIGESKDIIVAKHLVKNKDYVVYGQPICELETDKAVVEMIADIDGQIEWLVTEGTTLKVDEQYAIIKHVNQQKEPSKESHNVPFADYKKLLLQNQELIRENEAYKNQIAKLEEQLKN